MLRITVELWPGGRESGKRVIAIADIARVKDGAQADYEVELQEKLLESVGEIAHVRNYPRWSASVWDLVGRCITAALNGGKEELPPRPITPDVPVHVRSSDGMRYVRFDEIPEPARTFFGHNLDGSSIPAHDCAYAHDWHDFLNGYR
jgi:predicted house-cleaning noncanonical NTP pyrophosphatase (MazG superfamily)